MKIVSTGAYAEPDRLVFKGESMRVRDRKLMEGLEEETRNNAMLGFGAMEVRLQSSMYYLSVVGHHPCLRTAEQQHKLYERGRFEKFHGIWFIDRPEKVVTYKDGYIKKSRHQSGKAMDVILRYRFSDAVIWANKKMGKEARKCWELVTLEFERLGFKCGIFKKNFSDANHFEYHG